MITAVKCKAKDPENCRFHGTVDSVAFFSAPAGQFVANPKAEHLKSANPAIQSALTSKLRWKGDKPKWWEKYNTEADNQTFDVKPELLDVIDSPEGPVAVIWQNESFEEWDRNATLSSGMKLNVCYLKSYETGENLGYIKITSVTEESFERSFGNDEFTPFRHQSRFSGSNYSFKQKRGETYGDRDLEGEELLSKRREVWVSMKHNLRQSITDGEGNYIPYYNINKNHLPDDEKVKKDLDDGAKIFKKQIKNRKNYYKTPYIDMSSVEGPLNGKGFGTSLYIYAAKRLAVEGKALRGSGLQSDDAQDVWARFKKYFPGKVKTMELDYNGEKDSYPIFDFRD